MKKIFVVFIILIIFLGCSPEEESFKFEPGDFVTSVLSEQKGQVTYRYRSSGRVYYKVRFASEQLTINTHILNNNGPITRELFNHVEMQEFELKPYKK